jgi:hypothetical protein
MGQDPTLGSITVPQNTQASLWITRLRQYGRFFQNGPFRLLLFLLIEQNDNVFALKNCCWFIMHTATRRAYYESACLCCG